MCRKYVVLILAVLVIFSGCGREQTKETPEISSVADTFGESIAESSPEEWEKAAQEAGKASKDTSQYGKAEDWVTDIPEDAIYLTGKGDAVDISGGSVQAQAGAVTITEAGTYVLEGSFNGQVLIDAGKEDMVHLVLAGADIVSGESSAIYGAQSDKIIITLKEGTGNTVTDGSVYAYAQADTDEPNAVIFSKDDLTLNGTGTLKVQGNYEDGIRSKDDLLIVSGTYEITAKQDAVQGKDSVTIVDGIFSITAGNDAIKASNDTDTEKGWVTIAGGTYAIVAEDDAIHAETDLVIEDGTIDIKSCYEGIEGLRIILNGGQISLKAEDDGINAAGGDSGESSARGAFDSNPDAYVEINGGNIFVDAEGDGIDSNGTLTVNGGTVFIEGPEKSGNGALDYALSGQVSGGTFVATGSSGMAMSFDSESTQCFILYNLKSSQKGGTTLVLKDETGKELLSREIAKSYNSVLISMEELEADGTYVLTAGTETAEITLDDMSYGSSQGGFGPGG